jgi:enoyl-CoA hydratase
MTDENHPEGSSGKIRTEVHEHVLKIIIDNVTKKNAFTPDMLDQLSDALTLLDETDEYWAGVVCAQGDDFTAGLDMPEFFGPHANKSVAKARQGGWFTEGKIDVFALQNKCSKPLVMAVQGIVFTIGIELMLAGDIVIAADNCRFCQMEAKRGIAPVGGAYFRYLTRTGWGNAMYHLLLCDEFSSEEAFKIGLVQEIVPAGQQIQRAMEVAQLIAKNAPLAVQAT